MQLRAQELRVHVPVEPVVVMGDAARLEQIVGNLLSNAIKYTDVGGRIELRVERHHGRALLRVRDNGAGMTADMVPRVFQLFAQADSSLARSHGGLGIGLTIVARLAELHGGRARAESRGLDHGSTFFVELPLAGGGTRAAPPPPPALTTSSRRILLVEDSRDARALLRVVLELDGHVVEEATDGTTGIRMAVEWAPDIVLLDIGLPGLDGYEVARRIRKRLGHAVRLVAVSGYGGDDARRRSAEAGFDMHLLKPLDPDQLVRALATV